MCLKIANIFTRNQNKQCILIENDNFSESNSLKNSSLRLQMEFTNSPKSVEIGGFIKYCPNIPGYSKMLPKHITMYSILKSKALGTYAKLPKHTVIFTNSPKRKPSIMV